MAGPDIVLSNPDSALATFQAPDVPADDTLEFSLTVMDVDGSHTQTVSVRVQNSQTNTPIALPQVSGTVGEGALITLDGSGSYDPNGDDLTYVWTHVSGPQVALSGANNVTATFQTPRVPDPLTLIFQLDVSDGITTGTARLSVTVPDDRNDPPVLQGIGPLEVRETDTLSFTASATDADGNDLSFSLAGAPAGASINSGTGLFGWIPDQSQDGIHLFNVTVRDGDGGTAYTEVRVTVHDIAPLPVSVRASSSSAITLTLSEVVTSSDVAPNGFSVSTQQNPVAINSVTGNGTAVLTLGLNGTVPRDAALSYDASSGDVADETGKALESFAGLDVLFPQSRSRSSSPPPVVDLGTLTYQRLADIPEYAAQRVASYGQSDPIPSETPDDTFDYPLMIDGQGYLLGGPLSTLVPRTITVGQPTEITFTVYDKKEILYFGLYLNLHDKETGHTQSDTYVEYNRGSGMTTITDPNGYIAHALITIHTDPERSDKKYVTITIEFGDPMGPTNMVAYLWNTDRKSAMIRIVNALDVETEAAVTPEPGVLAADPEPTIPDSELHADPEPTLPEILSPDDTDDAQVLLLIRMWSGFEPEFITDAQLLDALGLDYPDIDLPDWMMTELGVLVARGSVTVDEFKTALVYMLEHYYY